MAHRKKFMRGQAHFPVRVNDRSLRSWFYFCCLLHGKNASGEWSVLLEEEGVFWGWSSLLNSPLDRRVARRLLEPFNRLSKTLRRMPKRLTAQTAFCIVALRM